MEENLRIARNLVIRYGQYIQDQFLDGILDALCSDASVQTPNFPDLMGKARIGEFYTACFAEGTYQFDLAIEEEKSVSDLVFINGTLTQTRTGTDQSTNTTDRPFSFIMKKEAGELKVWQIRFA